MAIPLERELTPFDFTVEEVIVTAERLDGGEREFDLSRVVTEINIFEHIDKPFLTGTILFLDNANLYNEINWLGTEKVKIKLRTDVDSISVIEKNFRVSKILNSVKGNDFNETFLIEIVEDHAYESTIKRVQQSYEGYHHHIIEKILKDHLGRDLLYKNPTTNKAIRTIIPNMTPIEAANWLKDAMPDLFGSPYFLYSSIADDDLRLIDLESILGLPPLNKNFVYQYSQSVAQFSDVASVIDQSYIIQTYKQGNTEDLLKLVKSGMVRSKWNFFDTFRGDQYEVDHNIKTTFDSMVNRKVLKNDQNDPIFDEDAGVHEHSAREINQIATSNVFQDISNYHEEDLHHYHQQKVVQRALRHFLLKAPIDINVPGRNFLHKNVNKTIGNILRIDFQINDDVSIEYERDEKRSGDYLVYAARHVFTTNRYTVNLKCAKLGQGIGVER